MSASVTAEEVRALRVACGLEVREFATLLGVDRASVYRWESSPRPVRLDPLQGRLFRYLDRRQSAGGPQWRDSLRAAVQAGGTLHGLAFLLRDLAVDF